MKNSFIGWTHHTFNPWEGCSKVSPGCENCYAETECAIRYKRVVWGPGGNRRRVTTTINAPLKWHEEAIRSGKRLKVFCGSLCDIFDDHPSIQQEWRDHLWMLIHSTPWLPKLSTQRITSSKRPTSKRISTLLPRSSRTVISWVGCQRRSWANRAA